MLIPFSVSIFFSSSGGGLVLIFDAFLVFGSIIILGRFSNESVIYLCTKMESLLREQKLYQQQQQQHRIGTHFIEEYQFCHDNHIRRLSFLYECVDSCSLFSQDSFENLLYEFCGFSLSFPNENVGIYIIYYMN